jgi:hypothetical protein
MEVATMMYGVSMSTEGTSKVVAQRFDDPATSRNGAEGDAVASKTLHAPGIVG